MPSFVPSPTHTNHLSFISRVISPADVALVCALPANPPLDQRGILKLCPFSSTRSKSRRDFRSFPLKRKERNLFDRIIRPYIYICIGVPSTVRRSLANYRYRSRVEHSLNDVLDSGAVPLVVRVVNDRTWYGYRIGRMGPFGEVRRKKEKEAKSIPRL